MRAEQSKFANPFPISFTHNALHNPPLERLRIKVQSDCGRIDAVVIPRVALKGNAANVFLTSIIQQVRLYRYLLARLEKDVSPELSNRLYIRAGVVDIFREPSFVVSNAFENPLRQGCLTFGVWNPVDTNSLTVSFPRQLPKIVDDVAIIDIIHEAHERVGEVMRDGFEDTVLHNRKRSNAGIEPPRRAETSIRVSRIKYPLTRGRLE